jgi:hypothetical protein
MSKRELASGEEPAAKVQKVVKPAYTFNVNKALDKAHETKTFNEILDLPPSALQGLAESADAKLAKMKIHTIRDLGNWKFYKISRAIVALAATEEEGKRDPAGNANLNHALDKAYEVKSLAEIVEAPISALSGLAEWVDEEVHSFRPAIKSISDLAVWQYCQWAEAIIILAEFENTNHSSR